MTPIRPSLFEALKGLAPPPPEASPELDSDQDNGGGGVQSGWTKIVGPRLASAVLNLTARLAAYSADKTKKIEAGEVSDSTAEYCAESMTRSLAFWFPDIALTPTRQLLVAFAMATGEQWIGREEIEAAPPPALEKPPTTRPPTPPPPLAHVVTTAPPPPPPPPAASEPMNTMEYSAA